MVFAELSDSKLLTSWEIPVGRAKLGSMLGREVNQRVDVNEDVNWVQLSMSFSLALQISLLNWKETTARPKGETILVNWVPRAGCNWLVKGSR